MTTLREAAQQALRLIEDEGHKADLLEAASILRAALAEQDDDLTAAWMAGAAEERKRAEQAQPVAWTVKDDGLYWTVVPRYTTPPSPQPLTDEDIDALVAQEQTLEQEPSNPKEKEMTDPNSVSFNLNTDALPVEWLRLDGTGFHYKGKVIEDAGEAYDLFKEWLAMAHQQPSAQRLTDEEILSVVGWERAEMFMKLLPNFPVDEVKQEALKNARAVEAEVLKRVGVGN